MGALVPLTTLCLLLLSTACFGGQSDVQCLQALQHSVDDPNNILGPSWNFSNGTAGFICKFVGVECWHPEENRVLNLHLGDLGLKGSFPSGLANCSTMTGLDLSNNFSGPLPADISKQLPYLTSLDLSSNAFSGAIPINLSNCRYLNKLSLQNNQFTGAIPWQLSDLSRLSSVNVANNFLSGPIPSFLSNTPAGNFVNNLGLCGSPLSACNAQQNNSGSVIIGAVVGGVIATLLCAGVILFICLRKIPRKTKDKDENENKWARNIRRAKAIKVAMFEKQVSKMNLGDLMKATNEFSKEFIIGTGRTGTMYRAVLTDGSFFAVKRLQDSQHSESQFAAEMKTLACVRHRNLVPLLGFCIAKKERLLVYEHMPNGTLYDQLHREEGREDVMEWRLRLKVAIGAAKGVAYLHHSCNPRILHRNISSKCILLDKDYEPKISDFGLARLMNPIDTHLSTLVNGEFGDFGYVAPEYARTLVATPKGDVYSFGVVLLEIVTGQKPTQVSNGPELFNGSLVDWINYLSINSVVRDAIDKSLLGKDCDGELVQFLKVACSCTLSAAKERPTMFEVYQLLRAIGERYHFTADAEIMMPSETADGEALDELIVAQS